MRWGFVFLTVVVAVAIVSAAIVFPDEILTVVKSAGRYVHSYWEPLANKINEVRPTFDPIIWFSGALLAVVPGSFAIYKWLYYGRTRLPRRYEEMLVTEEERLLKARKILLQQVRHPQSIHSFKMPIFIAPALRKALKSMRWFKYWQPRDLSAAAGNLDKAIEAIDRRMEQWEEHKSHQLNQRATALLLRGAIASANADERRRAGANGDDYNREALNFFERAIEIDATDIEAIEYAAHQYLMLGELDRAIERYGELEKQAKRPGPEYALAKTRALRYLGEAYERKYDQGKVGSDLTRAKTALDAAIDSIPVASQGQHLEAYIYRWAGTVEDKRETATLWKTHFDRSESIFKDILIRDPMNAEAKAGRDEVRLLRSKATTRRDPKLSPPELVH